MGCQEIREIALPKGPEIILNSTYVPENVTAGTLVGVLFVLPPSGGKPLPRDGDHRFELIESEGTPSLDSSLFQIRKFSTLYSGLVVKGGAVFDRLTQPELKIKVRVHREKGKTLERSFRLRVTPPMEMTLIPAKPEYRPSEQVQSEVPETPELIHVVIPDHLPVGSQVARIQMNSTEATATLVGIHQLEQRGNFVLYTRNNGELWRIGKSVFPEEYKHDWEFPYWNQEWDFATATSELLVDHGVRKFSSGETYCIYLSNDGSLRSLGHFLPRSMDPNSGHEIMDSGVRDFIDFRRNLLILKRDGSLWLLKDEHRNPIKLVSDGVTKLESFGRYLTFLKEGFSYFIDPWNHYHIFPRADRLEWVYLSGCSRAGCGNQNPGPNYQFHIAPDATLKINSYKQFALAEQFPLVPFANIPESVSNRHFRINGEWLELVDPIKRGLHKIHIRGERDKSGGIAQTFQVLVTEELNPQPLAISLNLETKGIPRHTLLGSFVGSFSSEKDKGSRCWYNLVDSPDGSLNDNKYFEIFRQGIGVFSLGTPVLRLSDSWPPPDGKQVLVLDVEVSRFQNQKLVRRFELPVSSPLELPLLETKLTRTTEVGTVIGKFGTNQRDMKLMLSGVRSFAGGDSYSIFALGDGSLWVTGCYGSYRNKEKKFISYRAEKLVDSGVKSVFSPGIGMFTKENGHLWGLTRKKLTYSQIWKCQKFSESVQVEELVEFPVNSIASLGDDVLLATPSGDLWKTESMPYPDGYLP